MIAAELKFVTEKPVGTCPKILSLGGYEVKTKDGKKFRFDWSMMWSSTDKTQDGRMSISATLDLWDSNYWSGNDGASEYVMANSIAKMITSNQLTEVYYECLLADEDKLKNKHIVRLILKSFTLCTDDKNYEFPKNTINTFNRLYNRINK